MNIRIAKVEDIKQIKLLIDRNFDEIMSKFHSQSIVNKFKSHNALENLTSQLTWKTIYVVEQDDKIIATGAFANFGTSDKPKYSISNMFVLPEFHSKGIGKIIFEQLLQNTKDMSADSFHVPSSRNAVAFYEKMGFIVDESQPDKDDEITWMTMKM